jgi:hypothetical protein
MNSGGTGPKIAIGCGGALLFFAFLATAFGAFNVFLDPGGGVSDDEAMPALIGGVLCMFVDFLIVVVGIALLMRGGQSDGQPMQMGQPMQTGQQSQPGVPSGQPAAGFPWHFLTGCGSLFFLVTMCLSMGGVGYAYTEVQRWERMRDEDLSLGEDPLIIMIDESAIEGHQQEMMGGACCCTFSFVLLLAGAGGTFMLVRRRQQQS